MASMLGLPTWNAIVVQEMQLRTARKCKLLSFTLTFIH
jgi:hypothetical protein